MNINNNKALRFDPLNDFLFYKVMGEKGSEKQLLGFLNAVLGKREDNRFTSVEIIENKTFTPVALGYKSCTLDVCAVLQSKTRVNVEVQLRNQHNLNRRSLFYSSKEYSQSLLAGIDYSELPNVIAINIVNYDYPPIDNFHTCFHLREDKNRDYVLTKALEIHYLNMVQYRKQGRDKLEDPLCRWLTWLDKESPPEKAAEAAKMDEAIMTAEERMVYVTGDDEAIRAYWRRQMALADRVGELRYARDEGMEEGRTEKTLEIARKMKEMGDSPERIQAVTSLSPEAIEKLPSLINTERKNDSALLRVPLG